MTDRAHVTLDRRELQDRRSGDRRVGPNKRQGADRRQSDVEIDFGDRRKTDRRQADRRSIDRRSTARRSDRDNTEAISDEEFDRFASPPMSKKRLLSQVLIVVGLLWLLTQL